jgi:hypothetical protein
MVNVTLEKRERVTMGGKGRDEIRGEVGKVTGMVADSLGKKCGAFGGWQLKK